MTKMNQLILIGMVVILFASCASSEVIEGCVDVEAQEGFIFGVFHGFFAPLAFIWSIFSDDMAMYAINNSGGWYDFGFLVGIGGFSGGIFKSTRKK